VTATATRGKREAGPLPARFNFGPQFLAQSTTRTSETVDLFGIHDFNETGERPCPRCGGDVVYRYGNWLCISVDLDAYNFRECGWNSARLLPNGRSTLEKCPDCGGRVIYNGNYFCERRGGECGWALPCQARRTADRELALRLTGRTS
jgi:rRNA maturation protein Nop10